MYLVIVNKDNLPQDVVLVTTDLEKAQQHFLDTCQEHLSNWDEYTSDDKDALLENGYEQIAGNGAVVLIDTSNAASDDAIRDELTKQPAGDITITQVIHDGELELKDGMTMDQIIEQCGSNLDACNAWDIQGQVVFKASDGKYYAVTTDATIGECTNEYITDVLSKVEHG